MMEQLLFARGYMISFFKRYETIILFVLKLLLAIFIFGKINDIGNSNEMLDKYVTPAMMFPLTMLMSILFTITPLTVGYLLIIGAIGFQLSAVIELSFVVVMALLCFLLLYIQLAPRESIFILATVIAYYFKLPYIIPIFAGIYCGLTCVVPITIGIFIWNYMPVVFELMDTARTAGLDILLMPETFSELLNAILNNSTYNQQWVFSAFIFAMATLVAYAVSRLSIDYSRHLAIGLASVIIIISFIIMAIVAGMQVDFLPLIFFVILSAALMVVVEFFALVLDYQRAERVQFEDDNNYYYVKVIPKIVLARRRRVVTRIKAEPDDETDRSN